MSDAADRKSLRLNAALDGELGPDEALALARDLAADPGLAAEYGRLKGVRDAVRRAAPRETAPMALVEKVRALAGAAAQEEPAQAPTNVVAFPHRARPSRISAWLPVAASFAVLGFAAGAGLTSLRLPDASQGVADGLVSDFSRAAIAGAPFDVASSDRHTVKPWLAGRTTVGADIVDLASQGFPLAGGRVSVIDRVPVPTLVYRHNEHVVAVTELPLDARGARAPEGVVTTDGYHVARWSDANFAYVAVSDMDMKTLDEFVAALRKGQAQSRGEAGG